MCGGASSPERARPVEAELEPLGLGRVVGPVALERQTIGAAEVQRCRDEVTPLEGPGTS
jgi:hypothetical protein